MFWMKDMYFSIRIFLEIPLFLFSIVASSLISFLNSCRSFLNNDDCKMPTILLVSISSCMSWSLTILFKWVNLAESWIIQSRLLKGSLGQAPNFSISLNFCSNSARGLPKLASRVSIIVSKLSRCFTQSNATLDNESCSNFKTFSWLL